MSVTLIFILAFLLWHTSVAVEHSNVLVASEIRNINGFIQKQTDNMKAFFEEQRSRVQKVVNTSLENAIKMKDSVNNYMEEQQRKISDDINNYVQSMRDSGQKAVDSWSYLPSDDSTSRLDNPDVILSVPGIIARHGYHCETHTVMSKGYLLNIHRIPRAKNTDVVPSKTVLLQHGLFACSADWIFNGPDKALAYTLAEAGYDVWMSNIRGNKYSREHAWLKTNSKSYWNFSWHDVAVDDIPSVIDYILNVKGPGTKINYIGHSMGTTILFAMLSCRPEYNEILNSAIALAPTIFMTDLKTPLKAMSPIISNVAYMEMLYGSHEFLPKNSPLGRLSSSCEVDKMDSVVCKNVIFYICGYDEKQFNKQLLPVFLAHLGSGTSWKTAVHFAQQINSSGRFQQFDYGPSHNQRVYGTDKPPEYDLSKVTLPLALFWAKNDLLSSEKDVKMLYERLPAATTEMLMVDYPEFNHLDYLWAVDAPSLVNDKVLRYLERKNSKESGNGFSIKINFG